MFQLGYPPRAAMIPRCNLYLSQGNSRL
uniref:Uncharacterized protein n=1 Tax=Arundo donax TaxID=35708 RepID=A0A0A8ZJ65_ARUDO